MKSISLRSSAALVALSSVLLLSACGGGDDPVAAAAVPQPPASAPTPPAPPTPPPPPAAPTPPAPPPALAAPTLAFVMPQESLDLSNYTLTGKYALPVGAGTNLLASEVSAVTYNADTDTLFVVGDHGTAIVQVSKTGQLINSMLMPQDATKPQGTYFYDPEGLTYVGNGQFVMAEERYRQATLFTYTAGTTLDPSKVKTVKLGTTIGNVGLEGVSYDPQTRGFVFVKEKTPLGIFQTGIDFTAGTATNGSATLENSTNLFDPALAAVVDFGDIYAMSNVLPATAGDYSALMVLSQESGRIVKMNRAGKVLGSLAIEVSAQHEGITFDKQLNMYITNELGTAGAGEELWVYAPTRSAAAVGVGSNLYLNFAAAISAGSGNLIVSNGAGDARTIAVTDATQVSFDGSTVIINPSTDLLPGSTYSVQYAAGAFKDAAGTLASAVNTPQALAFTTVADITAPRLVSTAPVDNAIGVTGSRVVLTLSEAVKAGAGNITISNGADDVRIFAANDITQVTISGATVDINPKADLRPGTPYFVLIGATALTDIAGNAFVGISEPTRLNFTTASSAIPTALAAGDLLFIAANADSPDAFAFILMTGINAGTSVFFSDRDSLTATNEAAFKWQADKAYPAGTIVTIQPDTSAGAAPLADKGASFGVGGGLSATSETLFAFQGSIAGLSNGTAGALTVSNYIAAINIGGAAGPLDPSLQAALSVAGAAGAFASFAQDNVKFNGALSASNIPALRALIANPANWLSSDTAAFPITGGSLFP